MLLLAFLSICNPLCIVFVLPYIYEIIQSSDLIVVMLFYCISGFEMTLFDHLEVWKFACEKKTITLQEQMKTKIAHFV